ncbi:DUF3995 domain-containing protein [Paenibacillus sp. YPG26]|uniref:DUF3995 domain-containing protein n=1 Tax=Paenibacillus sp. YPG26 TaxID=2878915 RepID=UPI00203F2550|nr:DUF3995 domain-containing protein [Paenibacillus sp. YPG26]USB33538.1 DUF3995 domain-containing protein [Paenibacillus sp. YPG26]
MAKRRTVFMAVVFILALILGYSNKGVISFRLFKPQLEELHTIITPAANDRQTFNAMKKLPIDGWPPELNVVQDPATLGDPSGYTFVTLTLTIKNTNYMKMKNLYIDLDPVLANKNQIILYTRDAQYIEVSPFGSSSSLNFNVLLKTNSPDQDEALQILSYSHLYLRWDGDHSTTIDFPEKASFYNYERGTVMEILSWAIGMILFILSALHIYWICGGRWGAAGAIPSRGGEPLFRPSAVSTGVVAILLALAAWLVLELEAIKPVLFPEALLWIGGWLLGAVFTLRAIGDFRWVGFFKKEKGTVFARLDSRFYSPLCLFLGVSILLIMVWG